MSLEEACWPLERAAEALELLARRAGLRPDPLPESLATWRPGEGSVASFGRWIEPVAARLDIEVESVSTTQRGARALLERAGPALVLVAGAPAARLVLLLRVARGRARVLAPNGALETLALDLLRDALCRPVEALALDDLRGLLDGIGLEPARYARALEGLLDVRVGEREVDGVWLVRTPPHRPLLLQLREAGLVRRLASIGAAHAALYCVWIAAWYLVGRGALEGRFEGAWLVAWVLALATIVPLRLVESWVEALLEVDAGVLLKRRLLNGALRLEPSEVRTAGAGGLLSRVMESEALEAHALGAAFLALAVAVEIPVAWWVLGQSAGRGTLPLVFLGFLALAAALAWRLDRRNRAWVATRLDVTHDLVERMVGHRTRLAQVALEDANQGEDLLLARYERASRAADGATVPLGALVPAAFAVVGLIGLAPALAGGRSSIGEIAVALGGLLLGQQSLAKLVGCAAALSSLRVAWREVGPIFRAGARRESLGVLGDVGEFAESAAGRDDPIVDARRVSFRYRERGALVLRDVDLEVRSGERVLLEGPSGSGKSTLAGLLLGLHAPETGMLLLHGLDSLSWGAAAWRRRIAASPQFHENHVFSGSLAFNLLLGRAWPPSEEDLALALELCRDLGLAELVETMPGGLGETVGETGWRLSHGERARLFVARALLQDSELLVIDESLGALDAAERRRVLACAESRANALVLIAHA